VVPQRPATTSASDAEPALISTIAVAVGEITRVGENALLVSRPRMETISPSSRNAVGDEIGRIQQPARIVAQIEDIAFERLRGDLRCDIADRLFQLLGGALVELRDTM